MEIYIRGVLMVRVIILNGYGINCDYETENAFRLAGASPEKVHVNDLISKKKNLEDYDILAVPGGFAYADDLGAGKVLANKIKYNLTDEFRKFIQDGKLVIGICNGFQVLAKLGILPGLEMFRQEVTLTFNDSGRFEDRWVNLKAPESKCIWTKDLDRISLPVRHGEGKFFTDEATLQKLKDNQQIALQYCDDMGYETNEYPANPNGSLNAVAGICDPSGRIFGLMPHPEAFMHHTNHPTWTRDNITDGYGLKIIKNAVDFAKEGFHGDKSS